MTGDSGFRLGLLIRSGPWCGRSSRDQLDIALAAAALGFELELFFMGAGVLQLLADRDGRQAGLPPGHKAWASLTDLAPTRAWVEQGRFEQIQAAGVGWLMTVQAAEAGAMLVRQAQCDRLLVI